MPAVEISEDVIAVKTFRQIIEELKGPDYFKVERDDNEQITIPTALINDTDWHANGLCSQTDPEAFFPEKGGSTREAKKVCKGCDVRPECLEEAMQSEDRFGIWGGLSERERRRLNKDIERLKGF